jgi:hypothetical protein
MHILLILLHVIAALTVRQMGICVVAVSSPCNGNSALMDRDEDQY